MRDVSGWRRVTRVGDLVILLAGLGTLIIYFSTFFWDRDADKEYLRSVRSRSRTIGGLHKTLGDLQQDVKSKEGWRKFSIEMNSALADAAFAKCEVALQRVYEGELSIDEGLSRVDKEFMDLKNLWESARGRYQSYEASKLLGGKTERKTGEAN